MKALIIGGGIGGLCAALALRRVGIEVQVFERVEAMQEVGAGLTLWANALHALRRLGLEEMLRQIDEPYSRAIFRTAHGTILAETPVRALEAALGQPLVAVHRADLQSALLRELGEETVQFGACCLGLQQDKTGVLLHLANGQDVRGDILIGADGIHSVVRSVLFGKSEPRYAGYTAWRGVARFSHTQTVFETWGRGIRFGYVPLTQGRTYWFASRNAPEGLHTDIITRKQGLLALFRHWHEPIADIIEATEASAILHNDIYELPSLQHWSMRRVALLGDAAHAMTPNLGQGACQAIEDAVMLADCLQQYTQPEEALHVYERRRIKRVNTILRQSRLIGWVGQWENPIMCGLRDLALRTTPPILMRKMLVRVVDYKV